MKIIKKDRKNNGFPLIKRKKILFVASESAPFAKAGGLGDVINSLSLALKELGEDVRVMIPRYGIIDLKKYKLKTEVQRLKVPTDQPGENPFLICNVKKYSGKEAVTTYFLENEEYYEKRANVYGYGDDHIRWILLCRGVLEFLKFSLWKPDIIISSDWQTGILSNYLNTTYKEDPVLSKISTIFTIHNLQYQGMCDFRFIQETERDSGKEAIPDFFNPRLAKLNWILRGILYNDAIITVSPTYAKEILTLENGEGLNKIFTEKQDKIFGILNGINNENNNPLKSKDIPVNYAIKNVDKRKENKILLQKRFGLPEDENIFLMGIVSRFTEQKGLDLIEKIMPFLFKNISAQIIFIGDGEPRYKEMIKKAEEENPDCVRSFFEFSHSLPYFVFSGADVLLMPSKFEPCGITQMEAMRFGCIPIVRKTGGLTDTVKNFNSDKEIGDGFVFENYDYNNLFSTIIRAETIFRFKKEWKEMIKRAMKEDFSWKKSAKEYISVFNNIKKD